MKGITRNEMTQITRATLSVALYARQMQFTWDQSHYLEVRPYQNVKSIRQAVFKISDSQAINCCGGHLGFCRMPRINSVRGQSDKRFSRYRVHKQLWTDVRTDGQRHTIIRPSNDRRIKISD